MAHGFGLYFVIRNGLKERKGGREGKGGKRRRNEGGGKKRAEEIQRNNEQEGETSQPESKLYSHCH